MAGACGVSWRDLRAAEGWTDPSGSRREPLVASLDAQGPAALAAEAALLLRGADAAGDLRGSEAFQKAQSEVVFEVKCGSHPWPSGAEGHTFLGGGERRAVSCPCWQEIVYQGKVRGQDVTGTQLKRKAL